MACIRQGDKNLHGEYRPDRSIRLCARAAVGPDAADRGAMSFANDDPEGQAREHHALLPLPKNGSSLDCGDRKQI